MVCLNSFLNNNQNGRNWAEKSYIENKGGYCIYRKIPIEYLKGILVNNELWIILS